MKAILFAAATVISLGSTAAFAQGLPPASAPPVYASHAFASQPYHTRTVFSEIFNHPRNKRIAGEKTAAPAKPI